MEKMSMEPNGHWNSVIFMKTSKPWSDLSKLSKLPSVAKMWSTAGEWGDICVMLNKENSSPEKTEEFVSQMRKENWASETKTHWWKEMTTR